MEDRPLSAFELGFLELFEDLIRKTHELGVRLGVKNEEVEASMQRALTQRLHEAELARELDELEQP